MQLLAVVPETEAGPGLKIFKNPDTVCVEISEKGHKRIQFAYSMLNLLAGLDPVVESALCK